MVSEWSKPSKTPQRPSAHAIPKRLAITKSTTGHSTNNQNWHLERCAQGWGQLIPLLVWQAALSITYELSEIPYVLDVGSEPL